MSRNTRAGKRPKHLQKVCSRRDCEGQVDITTAIKADDLSGFILNRQE